MGPADLATTSLCDARRTRWPAHWTIRTSIKPSGAPPSLAKSLSNRYPQAGIANAPMSIDNAPKFGPRSHRPSRL